jgi:tRNA G10  N-methylase Trm11
MTVTILGQHPHISLAEIESLYPTANIEFLNHQAAYVDCEVDIRKLGGTIKTAEPLVDRKDVNEAMTFITNYYQKNPPSSKINLGVSYYGANPPGDLYRQIMALKKKLKNNNVSARVVNQPRDKVLNAAQVVYNKLLTDKGQEWLLVKKHGFIVVAKTTAVQDVDEYAARDQARPSRDAKIGMLPPKLAKILVNLATHGQENMHVLDPFCGTGVVLQEAAIQGHEVTGTDINSAMVTASQRNIEWLAIEKRLSIKSTISPGDAMTAKWQNINAVACETYLGPPLSRPANKDFFDKNLREIDQLHEYFLKNIHPQIKAGTRLALALPAWWQPGTRFQRLPLVDRLGDLGYNRVDFESAKRDLIYHREGQYVARDIVVIERK